MSGDFLDTNVFLYLVDETSDSKRSVASRIVSNALASRDAAISFQVAQEALNVMVSKFSPPVRQEHAMTFLAETLMPLVSVMPSEEPLRVSTAHPRAAQVSLLRRTHCRRCLRKQVVRVCSPKICSTDRSSMG